jgi:FixJ family two-component response regulator
MPQTVYVVDDDGSTRELMAWLMKRNDIACETFADAKSFLKAFQGGGSGCLVLDLHMPGMGGLEVQRLLKEQGVQIPVIFLSGRADVSKAVEAVKSGAFDFIEKPFDYKRIVALIRECLAKELQLCADRDRRQAVVGRVAQLTQREREVMERVVAGQLNRVIAEELDISIKTVEAHRAHIMEKLEVNSVAELVQAALEAKAVTPGGR